MDKKWIKIVIFVIHWDHPRNRVLPRKTITGPRTKSNRDSTLKMAWPGLAWPSLARPIMIHLPDFTWKKRKKENSKRQLK